MNRPEAKVPTMSAESGDDDWKVAHYNQERMIANQERLANLAEGLLTNQKQLAEMATTLNEHLEVLSGVMREASKATSGLVAGIIKVPIVIVVMMLASAAFYFKHLEEHTWLIIMGVAVFPYLGDSITAVAKLIRGGGGNGVTK